MHPRSLAAGPFTGEPARQEAGVVAMGELARQYALGAELLQAAVGPRMGGAIRAPGGRPAVHRRIPGAH